MWASPSKRLLWLIAMGGLGLGLLIGSDLWPGLRGPAPDTTVWHWDYQPAPAARWGPAWLSASLLGLLGWWWWQRPPAGRWRTPLLLAALVVSHLLLQIALVYAHHADWPAELVNRTLANNSQGYFRLAAEVDDLPALLRAYPAAMPTFAAEHPRTHPPGLVILSWLTIQAWQRWPAGAEAMAAWVRPQRCADLWLLDRPPAVAAALGTWALLPGLLGALTIFPAYGLARALGGVGRPARLAAGLSFSLPALLLFLPQPDQLYPALTLTLIWAVWRSLDQTPGRPEAEPSPSEHNRASKKVAPQLLCVDSWRFVDKGKQLSLPLLAGGLLSLSSFLSLGNALLGGLVGLLLLLYPWPPAGGDVSSAEQARSAAVRHRLQVGLLFGVGAASLWLLYWVGWGVAPWAMVQTGLAQHDALVNSQRPYGVWLVYNLADLIIFAGWPVIVACLAAARPVGRPRLGRLTASQAWGVALGLFWLALVFSGGARGEVGRLWLFAMPLLGVSAGLYLGQRLGRRAAAILLGVQLGLGATLGLSWRVIEPVIVTAQSPPPLATPPLTRLAFGFDQGLRLTGAAWPAAALTPGDTFTLYLAWQGSHPTARPYTLFAHLLDPQGQLVAQADGWPAGGQWPPSCWPAGVTVTEARSFTLPATAPAGDYSLLLGWYDARDGQRLPLVEAAAPGHPAWRAQPDSVMLHPLPVHMPDARQRPDTSP